MVAIYCGCLRRTGLYFWTQDRTISPQKSGRERRGSRHGKTLRTRLPDHLLGPISSTNEPAVATRPRPSHARAYHQREQEPDSKSWVDAEKPRRVRRPPRRGRRRQRRALLPCLSPKPLPCPAFSYDAATPLPAAATNRGHALASTVGRSDPLSPGADPPCHLVRPAAVARSELRRRVHVRRAAAPDVEPARQRASGPSGPATPSVEPAQPSVRRRAARQRRTRARSRGRGPKPPGRSAALLAVPCAQDRILPSRSEEAVRLGPSSQATPPVPMLKDRTHLRPGSSSCQCGGSDSPFSPPFSFSSNSITPPMILNCQQ